MWHYNQLQHTVPRRRQHCSHPALELQQFYSVEETHTKEEKYDDVVICYSKRPRSAFEGFPTFSEGSKCHELKNNFFVFYRSSSIHTRGFEFDTEKVGAIQVFDSFPCSQFVDTQEMTSMPLYASYPMVKFKFTTMFCRMNM